MSTQNAYADDLYQFATFMHVRGLRGDEVIFPLLVHGKATTD
ncbi:hypothetical protein ACK9YZ_05350 [Rhizobium sp. ZK1]